MAVLPPMTGQDPLSTLPQYGGAGGGNQAAQYYAGQFFSQLFGRNPTQEELAQFAPYFMGADPNIANVAGGQQAISSYFNQQQQAAQAPQQEAQAIQQQLPIINQLVGAETKNLTDPNSQAYQQFSGLMNNMGITPSSGAFQAGIGGEIGQNANQLINSIASPVAQTYASGATTPFTEAMNRPEQLFGNNLDMQNFLQQMIAGQNIANANQPSGFEKYGLPLLSSGIQAGGNVGAAQLGKAPTWICTQLYREGLLSRDEVSKIHAHLFRAFWKRPLKFIGYIIFGKLLVLFANLVGTSWRIWKPQFYDYVMNEPNPEKAVDLYEEAFWNLFQIVRNRKFVSI